MNAGYTGCGKTAYAAIFKLFVATLPTVRTFSAACSVMPINAIELNEAP
jgi:hypothetical protein